MRGTFCRPWRPGMCGSGYRAAASGKPVLARSGLHSVAWKYGRSLCAASTRRYRVLYDFHCHTYLSDGELSPVELIRTACVNGYTAMAITDHAGIGFLEDRLRELRRDIALATKYWPIEVFMGVELTHLPPEAIPEVARSARAAGAEVIVVHGETMVEPVPAGTNMAALRCPDVDILGHPGLLTQEEALLAGTREVFVEISGRRGHSLSNGLVAHACLEAG